MQKSVQKNMIKIMGRKPYNKPLRRNSRPDFSHMLEKTNALRCNKSSKIGGSYIKILVYGMG